MEHHLGDWPSEHGDLPDWVDRFFSHLNKSKRPTTYFADRAWKPSVDIYETQEAIVVRAELPGVDSGELDLFVDGLTLVLRGNRATATPESCLTYHLMEIPFGPFERVVSLPAPVSAEQARAVYKNGFLDITLPKTSPGRQGRIILIQV